MHSAEEFLSQLEVMKKGLFNFARRNLYVPSDAEDVFSEAVLAAWAERGRFQPGSNFKSWVYRILLNKIYVANRRKTLDRKASQSHGAGLHAPSSAHKEDRVSAMVDSCSDEMVAALANLNAGEREAFLLLSLGGLTYAEIAAATDAPVTTVITRLGRARAKLRASLQGKINTLTSRYGSKS